MTEAGAEIAIGDATLERGRGMIVDVGGVDQEPQSVEMRLFDSGRDVMLFEPR